MKTFTSYFLFSILSLSSVLIPLKALAQDAFSIDLKGGLQVNEHYSLDGCDGCLAVPLDSGMNVGAELSYRMGQLRLGILADSQGEIFGPNQAYMGGLAAYTHDYLKLNINGGLEAGLHYVEEYGKLFGPNSVNDTDWVLLPYVGLRADADILVWPALGLRVGFWSALRADLTTFDQELLMEEGLFSDKETMETYRAGGIQLTGGLKLGLTI